ncbi:G protein-activated inward rectifier potassium channel 3 isoform X3 [Calliphora vicina]|uniref:G protein-activated inward rectifier potassium channel 3 isoform X2 n=1 Tax=Calliphora vicina TaxID=7373 RepID=UPI00325B5CDD
MIVDKTENMGEHAWTKLLDDKDSTGKGAVIVKMSNKTDNSLITDVQSLQNTKETSPLTGGLVDTSATTTTATTTTTTTRKVSTGELVTMETGKDGATECLTKNVSIQRKESILGTFHRHLRRSIKAVSESPGPITRYRQTRFSSRRVRKRVIFKHGDCNVVQGNVAKRRRRYLQDIFTTLVDAQWRWTLMVFAFSFLISWAFFGLIWFTIAYAHGDLEWIQMRDEQPELIQNMTHTMCVTEVRSFISAFLYSIETQHTIGYGNRFVTEECPEAIFTICLQCITGVFIQAFMVGIVFAKLSRPKKRAQTLLFSRNAVICHRDGVPCLMFRVGDMRKSHIIEAHVRAQIIRKKVTKEGEILPFYQQELTVGADGGEDRLMFIWPTTIVHKIDRHSPLYMLSASDMLKERFEVVCMLEGVIESTGMTTQARSSFLPSEILWGHRFVNVVSFRKETGEYEVDYTLFNNTYDVDTPLCSSKDLDDLKEEYTKNNKAGLDRALSVGLIKHISSAASVDHLDPASDESLDSGRLHIRSNSIPNGALAVELEPLNNNKPSFAVGGSTIIPTITTNFQSINELNNSNTNLTPLIKNNNNNNNNNSTNNVHSSNSSLKKSSNSRRLSIKQDQLPLDSLC